MSLLDWILGRKRDPPWLEDVRLDIAIIDGTVNDIFALVLRSEEVMSALTEAIAAVAQNVADVRTGVDTILALLADGDTDAATEALNKLAADLQGVEDSIAAATAEEPPPPVEG